jgi:hypothetical protein
MDANTKARVRWFQVTPLRVVVGLLSVECLLWFSERVSWLPWRKGYAVLTAMATIGVAMLLMIVWFAVAMVFRSRFQFTIRLLLVLTVVVALPCSWLAVEVRQTWRERDITTALQKVGGEVFYDYELGSFFLTGASPPGPAWLRSILGNDFFSYVESVDFLRFSKPHVHKLSRWNPHVVGAALDNLKGLSHLKHLDLCLTPVTDAELQHLKGLNQLKWINLYGTRVTDAGMKDLQQALPNCEIYPCPGSASLDNRDGGGAKK